jgi:Spy/CpxP family protein refolding chaperone
MKPSRVLPVSLREYRHKEIDTTMKRLFHISLAYALAAALAVPTVAAAQMAPAPTAKNPHYFTRAVHSVTVSPSQSTKIAAITAAYRKAHPDSAPHDAKAEAQFHQDISNVLTPAQRLQVAARVKQLRAAGVAKP